MLFCVKNLEQDWYLEENTPALQTLTRNIGKKLLKKIKREDLYPTALRTTEIKDVSVVLFLLFGKYTFFGHVNYHGQMVRDTECSQKYILQSFCTKYPSLVMPLKVLNEFGLSYIVRKRVALEVQSIFNTRLGAFKVNAYDWYLFPDDIFEIFVAIRGFVRSKSFTVYEKTPQNKTECMYFIANRILGTPYKSMVFSTHNNLPFVFPNFLKVARSHPLFLKFLRGLPRSDLLRLFLKACAGDPEIEYHKRGSRKDLKSFFGSTRSNCFVGRGLCTSFTRASSLDLWVEEQLDLFFNPKKEDSDLGNKKDICFPSVLKQSKGYSKNPKKVAYDRKSGREIFIVRKNRHPAQQVSDPWTLLDPSDILAISRKFKLSRRELAQIKKAYKTKSARIELDQLSVNHEAGIRYLESLIIKNLQQIHVCPSNQCKFFPYFELGKKKANIILVQGATHSGKTHLTFLDLLLSKPFLKQKVYILSPHTDHNDKENRYQDKVITEFLDKKPNAKKLVRRLDLKQLELLQTKLEMADFEEHCTVVVDDAEGHARSSFMAKMLTSLANQIATSGRHRNISLVWIIHNWFQGGNLLSTLKAEAGYYFIMLRSNRAPAERYLKQQLNIPTKKLKAIWRRSGESRWALFCLLAPSYVMSENHIEILE